MHSKMDEKKVKSTYNLEQREQYGLFLALKISQVFLYL
jgi:hypothetical protein